MMSSRKNNQKMKGKKLELVKAIFPKIYLDKKGQ